MRFWLLSALLNGLFALVMHFAAPEMVESTAYYAGMIICTLIALVVTWGDPPGLLDRVLIFVVQWGLMAGGLVFFAWGVGYKLGLWGNQDVEGFSSLFDTLLPNIAMLTGILILGVAYLRHMQR